MLYNNLEDKIVSREVKILETIRKLELLYSLRDTPDFSDATTIVRLELIVNEVQLELDNLYLLQNLLEITSKYS